MPDPTAAALAGRSARNRRTPAAEAETMGTETSWDATSWAAGPFEPGAIVAGAYLEHRGALVRWLTARTRDPELAEELAQEAYIRLLATVRSGVEVLDQRAWLFHAARNLLLDQVRRTEVAERHAPSLAAGEEAGTVETVVLAREWIDDLDAALGRLDAGDRDLLVAAGNGVPGPAIARRLGLTDVAFRTRLHRARRRLRAELELEEATSA
jgi:RNA polymerase sigma-70 factor (ECF subfamily)